MTFKSLTNRNKPIGVLNPEVFEDLKLKELLTELFSVRTADSLWETLKFTCSSEDIRLRQQVFEDLENSEIILYFSNLSDILFEIEKFREVFNKKYDEGKKTINFLSLMSYYISFFNEVLAAPYKYIKAEIINDFIDEFKEIVNSDIFIAFETDYKSIKDKIKKMEPMQVDVTVENGRKVSIRLSEAQEPSMTTKLRKIAAKIGIEVAENESSRLIETSSDFSYGIEKLYPNLFNDLINFLGKYESFFDERILEYKKQLLFYINMNVFYKKLENSGIPLCLPTITHKKQIYMRNAYDITLLVKQKNGIVPNEVDFTAESGFYILTGANGGGKTTYIRTVGVCQILFLAGGYLPAESGKIYTFNNIFTHFPVDEKFENMGRLKEETKRLDDISNTCDENSIILLNETFSSTNEELSLKISMEYIEKLCKKGVFGVFVTHQHQIAEFAEELNQNQEVKTKTNSLSTEIDKDKDNIRTYKIVKKREMKSYAFDIFKKYGLTKPQLESRRIK